VRAALSLPPDTPVVHMDAREQSSCLDTLVRLVEHALRRTALVDGPTPASS
jgi:uncharacterized protein